MGSSEKELRRNRRRSPVCSLKLLPQPTLRGSSLWLRRSPSCASGFDFACMELPTICHLRWRVSPLALPLRRPKKNRFAEKELWLSQTGQYRVRRPVGEFAFWVFSVAMIWRRRVGTDFSGLFGFGPKSGGFVVQKRT